MTPIEDIVLEALAGVYGSDITGIDLLRYSPARLYAQVSDAIDAGGTQALLRDLGLGLTVVFGVLFMVALFKLQSLRAPVKSVPSGVDVAAYPVPDGPLRAQWDRVLAQLDSPRESDWKQAVMDADKLADLALSNAGYPGAGIGERLMNIGSGQLSSLDGVWWAHKIRNRLAHEVGYTMRYPEAKQAIGYYEQALNELQAI